AANVAASRDGRQVINVPQSIIVAKRLQRPEADRRRSLTAAGKRQPDGLYHLIGVFETIGKLRSKGIASFFSFPVEGAPPCIDGPDLVLENPKDIGVFNDRSRGD